MMIFMVLPLVALAYIGWHAWVMIFLVLDLGRLVHLVPKSLLFHNWQSAAVLFARANTSSQQSINVDGLNDVKRLRD